MALRILGQVVEAEKLKVEFRTEAVMPAVENGIPVAVAGEEMGMVVAGKAWEKE